MLILVHTAGGPEICFPPNLYFLIIYRIRYDFLWSAHIQEKWYLFQANSKATGEKDPTLTEADFEKKYGHGMYIDTLLYITLGNTVREDLKMLDRLGSTNYSFFVSIFYASDAEFSDTLQVRDNYIIM